MEDKMVRQILIFRWSLSNSGCDRVLPQYLYAQGWQPEPEEGEIAWLGDWCINHLHERLN